MEITTLQGSAALTLNQPDTHNQGTNAAQTHAGAIDSGRSAWREPASTVEIRGDKKGSGAEDSPELPPPLRGTRAGADNVASAAELPPPLNDKTKSTGNKATPTKPVADGILHPVNGATVSQRGTVGPVAADKVDVQSGSEPVARAIKEKVDHLFKVYPNGGTTRHSEKVPSHPDPSATRAVPGGTRARPAVSVDKYA
ncbi:MAG: hypothetical protein HQL66_00475 [Magnetococcales bacterium]|nr:hypothetical protein [Magnetococcales bacterium]